MFIADIKSALNLTRAAAYGVTLDANPGAYPTGRIVVGNAASLTDEAYSLGANNGVVAFNVSATDLVNLTIDGVLTYLELLQILQLSSLRIQHRKCDSPSATEFVDLIGDAWNVTYVVLERVLHSIIIYMFN